MANITINGQKVKVAAGKTVLQASLDAGIYIPHICFHPQLDSLSEIAALDKVYQGGVAIRGNPGDMYEGCDLCLVQIEGRENPVQSCKTLVADGLVVRTDSIEIKKIRQKNLAAILERHPHACLLCPQAEGCDRKGCSVHVPENERCCSKFGDCELQKVSQYIGMESGLPPYVPLNASVLEDEPLIKRDYNLCIGCLRCVKVCNEVKGADALGFVMDGDRVVVGSKEPTLKESGCNFCGYCIEVCPTGALLDKDAGLGERKKILVPCRNRCAAEVDVPRYIRHISHGESEKALRVIYEKVPFPGVLGRVCFHPCEDECRRANLDQPLSICALKRYAADENGSLSLAPVIRDGTGKKVGIIGSGPAGLTAAYYLSILGHSVTVFEALAEVGGMLRVGIPEYRLPRDVLDREIRFIADAGVEIKTNHSVDSLEELFAEGCNAVFAAVGAHEAVKLGIPGEDCEGVLNGVHFLRKANLGQTISVGKRVAIIGGGNVAMDAARSALRMGAESLTIFYRRTREEMPAHEEEVIAALDEGIIIRNQVSPIRMERANGGIEIEFIRMEMGEPDESKRRRPLPVKGSEHKVVFDTVISAIGQRSTAVKGINIPLDGRGKVEVDNDKGVFVGGDFLTGPLSVIDAIAGGRKGAVLIDKFLGGDGNIEQKFTDEDDCRLWAGPDAIHIRQRRVSMPMLPIDKRDDNFGEVSLGLDSEKALVESGRCLSCDLRFKIIPAVLPPELWLVLCEESVESVPETEGVYILYDEQKEICQILGVENIRQELHEELAKSGVGRFFSYEEDEMYTGRERQLIQQYMKKHGKMPPGNDELDDLF